MYQTLFGSQKVGEVRGLFLEWAQDLGEAARSRTAMIAHARRSRGDLELQSRCNGNRNRGKAREQT